MVLFTLWGSFSISIDHVLWMGCWVQNSLVRLLQTPANPLARAFHRSYRKTTSCWGPPFSSSVNLEESLTTLSLNCNGWSCISSFLKIFLRENIWRPFRHILKNNITRLYTFSHWTLMSILRRRQHHFKCEETEAESSSITCVKSYLSSSSKTKATQTHACSRAHTLNTKF